MGVDISFTSARDNHGLTDDQVFMAENFRGNASITHNVVPMWEKAGVCDAIYNSHDKLAGELIEVLQAGLKDMEDNYEEYEKLNPENEWGDAEEAIKFLRGFLYACILYPEDRVQVWK